MEVRPDYDGYAAMMRKLIADGTDLEVDARFVDMLAGRGSTILDIGCGHGSAVDALRRAGHQAFGIDPTSVVLEIARERFAPSWFAELSTEQVTPEMLGLVGLPTAYDVILMAGNVPAFLPTDTLAPALDRVHDMLRPGGFLVVGTTAHAHGGPADLDVAAHAVGLSLSRRFADWHLGEYTDDSPYSVSLFAAPGTRPAPLGPDGIFVLGEFRGPRSTP